MKRLLLCVFLLGTTLALGGTPARAADSTGKDVIVGPLRFQWDMTKKLVLGIAEMVPESKYDYRPTPEVRSFREQFVHIVGENYNYMAMIAGDPAPDRSKFEALKTRDEILKALTDSYDYGTKALANLTDEKAADPISIRGRKTLRWGAALYNIQDNMDHYGNLVTYVRLNGMVPPRLGTPAQPPQQKK